MTMNFTPPTVDLDQHHAIVDLAPHRPQQPTPYRQYFKRLFDIAFATAALLVSFPFILIMGALIAMDGHNPFYSHLRVGKDGKSFRIWKLRTMVANADDLLEDYLIRNPEARHEWETTQKLKRDPRITRVGALLRKISMDELPQFWNIMNGTMSVVGPRPMMISQQGSYNGKAYYTLRPGLTGLWQVSDRNEGEFVGRVRYDEKYARTVSFKTDVQVVWQTFGVVLRGTGY